MGAAAQALAVVPLLHCEFADVDTRTILGDSLIASGTLIQISNGDAIPDYTEHNPLGVSIPFRQTNPNYYRELVQHGIARSVCRALQFAITNTGSTTALDVRIELVVRYPNVILFDEENWPQRPTAQHNLTSPRFPRFSPSVTVTRLADRSLINIRYLKVQPRATGWVDDTLYLGAPQSGDVTLEGKIMADNIPTPQPARLVVSYTTNQRQASWEEVAAAALKIDKN